MSNRPIVVLYHHPCSDGMAAALAAYLKLGDSATYIGCTYKDRPEIPDGALVYFVDYSWPKADLEALAQRCHVVVIDHHHTAKADLETIENAHWRSHDKEFPDRPEGWTGLEVYFDGNYSGAVLAWCFFHFSEDVPKMYEFIQDRDLWRWELPGSKDFSYYLRAQELTLETYEAVWRISKNKDALNRMLDDGALLRNADENTVRALLNYAHPCKLGYGVMAVNSIVLPSELGEALCDKYPDAPFGAVYYRTEDGRIKWSLRSRGDFDVSVIAKQYGGGGHKGAAGFYSTPALAAQLLGDGGPRFEHYNNGCTYEKLAEGTANDVIDHGDQVVVYRAEGTGNVYVRTADNFNGPAIAGEFPGKQVPRFKPL
jgi:hypothetical protein